MPTIVSLNPVMVDGTGMCGGCRVTVDGHTRYACVDGPEFDAFAVDFDELADRLTTYRPFEKDALAKREACRVGLSTRPRAAVRRRRRHTGRRNPAMTERPTEPTSADPPAPAPAAGGPAVPGSLAEVIAAATEVPAAADAPHPLSAKERMAIDRVAMPEQDADLRATNFREVNLGLTYQLAMLEAERCLQCPKPYCIDGCPVRVNIPRFIKLLREGDLPGAADSLLDDNALPCVTGRVCPQETQCEGVCLRGKKGKSVAIGGPRALRRRLGPASRRRAGPPAPDAARPDGRRDRFRAGRPDRGR